MPAAEYPAPFPRYDMISPPMIVGAMSVAGQNPREVESSIALKSDDSVPQTEPRRNTNAQCVCVYLTHRPSNWGSGWTYQRAFSLRHIMSRFWRHGRSVRDTDDLGSAAWSNIHFSIRQVDDKGTPTEAKGDHAKLSLRSSFPSGYRDSNRGFQSGISVATKFRRSAVARQRYRIGDVHFGDIHRGSGRVSLIVNFQSRSVLHLNGLDSARWSFPTHIAMSYTAIWQKQDLP